MVKSIKKDNLVLEEDWINLEQEKAIVKLEEILAFLKTVTIKNEESLAIIQRPLEDLQSSLKYLPVDPSFDILPTEIKTKILKYHSKCDNEAFMVASVCQQWKNIFLNRLENWERVRIGKHCSCENDKCFWPKEMLQASIHLQLDIPLSICHPVIDVDSQLITEALTSVSNISLNEDCECKYDDDCIEYHEEPLMTKTQVDNLFLGLEKKTMILDSLEIIGLDFGVSDEDTQDRAMNCILNKTRKFTLEETPEYLDRSVIDIGTLTRKLLDSTDYKLDNLNIGTICEYLDELSVDFADALCNVKTVKLYDDFPLKTVTVKRLVENILTGCRKLKTLELDICFDWGTHINTQDLKNMIERMETIAIRGRFTSEQLETARSVPGVETLSTSYHNSQLHFIIIFKNLL